MGFSPSGRLSRCNLFSRAVTSQSAWASTQQAAGKVDPSIDFEWRSFQRCDNRSVLNRGFSRWGQQVSRERVFQQSAMGTCRLLPFQPSHKLLKVRLALKALKLWIRLNHRPILQPAPHRFLQIFDRQLSISRCRMHIGQ